MYSEFLLGGGDGGEAGGREVVVVNWTLSHCWATRLMVVLMVWPVVAVSVSALAPFKLSVCPACK
jgi:hypothetical protein